MWDFFQASCDVLVAFLDFLTLQESNLVRQACYVYAFFPSQLSFRAVQEMNLSLNDLYLKVFQTLPFVQMLAAVIAALLCLFFLMYGAVNYQGNCLCVEVFTTTFSFHT